MPARADSIFYLHKPFYIMRQQEIEKFPGMNEVNGAIGEYQDLQQTAIISVAIQQILDL